jgi:hypothetical protein
MLPRQRPRTHDASDTIQPPAKVDILIVQLEAFVEPSERLPHRPFQQQQ